MASKYKLASNWDGLNIETEYSVKNPFGLQPQKEKSSPSFIQEPGKVKKGNPISLLLAFICFSTVGYLLMSDDKTEVLPKEPVKTNVEKPAQKNPEVPAAKVIAPSQNKTANPVQPETILKNKEVKQEPKKVVKPNTAVKKESEFENSNSLPADNDIYKTMDNLKNLK